MARGLELILVFAFGCAVGSFLNVVRYRLPRRKGVVRGRSRCPECDHEIGWYDNIPLVSFVLLRRRCRWCGWRIPWTYLVLEVAAGLSFVLVWNAFPPHAAAGYWLLAAILIVCAGIDHDLGIIPDRLTLPGMVLGLALSVTLLRQGTPEQALVRSALGIAVGAGSLLVIAGLYRLIRRVQGMGGGDIKLMAVVGAFLGLKLALLTIFVAAVAGGAVGLVVMRRSSKGMMTSIPFGVFLSPAAIFALLWGQDVLDAYFGLIK
jgi:leader peptidase (prepilin peptidase)/N-methyltransferase